MASLHIMWTLTGQNECVACAWYDACVCVYANEVKMTYTNTHKLLKRTRNTKSLQSTYVRWCYGFQIQALNFALHWKLVQFAPVTLLVCSHALGRPLLPHFLWCLYVYEACNYLFEFKWLPPRATYAEQNSNTEYSVFICARERSHTYEYHLFIHLSPVIVIFGSTPSLRSTRLHIQRSKAIISIFPPGHICNRA